MSAKKSKTKRAKAKPGKARQVHVTKNKHFVAQTGELASVTFKDAMKQTKRSMGHIYRCINDGRLPAFKVGRETVFRQSDINKLLTPVPYTPTKARGYKPAKARKATKPHPSKRIIKKARKVLKAVRASKGNGVDKGLKRSVAKALKGMEAGDTTGTA